MAIPQANPSKVFIGMGINEHPKDESATDMEVQAQKIESLQKEFKQTGKITPIKNGESKA